MTNRTTFMSSCIVALLVLLLPVVSFAADNSVCARVKIEIRQEMTLERQAFDAHMVINNGLTHIALENVDIDVTFSGKDGNPVLASSDPNNTNALFFIRMDSMENITNVDGSGRVQPSSTADIHWLIIPAPGASNGLVQGALYYVGATLRYTIGGQSNVTEVSPDYIYVKPMPELTLDYFLPSDVYGDDAFTPEIEPPIPFSLGVRVKNTGTGIARSLKIDSAQPKIVDNAQGLLIGFNIESTEVNGKSIPNTLLADFGDIQPNASGIARWIMTCTLSGRFVEFKAEYSHSDELGGKLTSLLEAVNTHFLVRDVLVDLPGRDTIKDFLAKDGDVYRIYESEGIDTNVLDQSSYSSLVLKSQTSTENTYTLSTPATPGFMYVRTTDPFSGRKIIKEVIRSDGKRIKVENAWLSKTRIGSDPWQYFFNLFDVNSTNSYTVVFSDSAGGPHAPVLQFIPDRTGVQGQQLSFIVEASDPDGTIPMLSASPLPALAKFTDQSNGTGVFAWTLANGQAGRYQITFTASDGVLKASQRVVLTIKEIVSDTTPPTPNPMTWATVPTGASPTSITMVANTATDTVSPPVSYSFDFVDSPTGGTGGLSSGWQSSTSYTNSGLQVNHQYGYRVKAKDAANNETGYSTPTRYAFTAAEAPTGITFGTVTSTSIQVQSTNPPSGLTRGSSGLLIENNTNSTNSGWKQDSNFWTNSPLVPNTNYSYRAKARNGDAAETGYSPSASKCTLANVPGITSFSNVTQTCIRANWTANGNASGTQYFCENLTKGTNSGWMTATSWDSCGLTCDTSYSFRVKTRNGDGIETGWTSLGSQSTPRCPQPFPFFDDFGTDTGWTVYEPGGWERGPAKAGGGENGNPDLGTDHSATPDNFILGFAIGADYPNNLVEKTIVSPPINCTGQAQVYLKFWRYLNVEGNEFDHARIDVSNDETNWIEIWENPVFDLTDNQWTQVVFDISTVAANQGTVYIRFTMGPTNSSRRFSGWNIDDLEVTSDYSGPLALYVPTADSPNPNIDEILIENGFGIRHFNEIPSDLSDYTLLIVSKDEACNSITANYIKNFVQNGGGAIIIGGTPKLFAGNKDDLSSIKDWFGAGSYGNDCDYGMVAVDHPFGTNLLVNDRVDYSPTSTCSGTSVNGLDSEATLITQWSNLKKIHSFKHAFGQGRVFYYAGNPGYSADPNPQLIENGLTLFEAGLLWAATPTTQYSLTVSVAGDPAGGSVSPSSQTVSHGATAVFTVTTNTGYTATVSEGTLSGSTWAIPNITSSHTVTVTFTKKTNMVTVLLKDSNGNPLSGGVVQYYSGGWQVFGTTDATGQVSKDLSPLTTYSFRMNYAFASQDKSQNVATNPTVLFQTTKVTVQLKDSTGTLMDTGTVQYYSGGWRDIGSTSGGRMSKELLPMSYSFSMNYGFARQEKSQNVSTNPLVVFQTTNVTVQLKDSTGALIDTGTVQYYSGGWRDIGSTSGGQVSKELLPVSYSFSMNYAFARQEKAQNVSTNPLVVFQTTNVTVQLKDSTGALMDTGTVQYYSGGWRDIGSTSGGRVSKELLPMSYSFSMTYAFARQEKSQNVSTNPLVVFQTTRVTVELRDSTGAPMDTGTVQYYSGGWRDIGSTSGGRVSKELLPASYSFSMTYAFARQEKSQNVSTNPLVVFQTTKVTVQLKDSTGALMDTGTIQYYSGGWRDIGSTSGGQVSKELLPMSYSFSMTYAFARQEKPQNIGTDPTVVFKTGQVHSDSGSCTYYYAGGWRVFIQDTELLPATYTFRFNDGTSESSYTIITDTVNHIH
jgi:hypothetical protein